MMIHDSRSRRNCVLAGVLLAAAACTPAPRPATDVGVIPTLLATIEQPGQPTTAATLPAPSSIPPSPTTIPPPAEPTLTVAVLVDTRSQRVTRDQAQALVNESALHLRALVPVMMVMVDYVEDSRGGSTTEILQRYMLEHSGALPNAAVILSFGDGDRAKLNGAYGYAAPGPAGYRNPFVSPLVGHNQMYVAVVDYNYKYMACGYGGSEAAKSASALNGECENRPGTACVEQNGYSMCANAVGRLYMSTPTYFAASMIIHSLLQPFAPGGAQDDYSTPECTARMGYPAGFRDLQEAQYHNDLCPFVYEDLLKSYQP